MREEPGTPDPEGFLLEAVRPDWDTWILIGKSILSVGVGLGLGAIIARVMEKGRGEGSPTP